MSSPLHQQLPLCCHCGSPSLYRRGLCKRCYNRGQGSRARFGGGRERVLARDRYLLLAAMLICTFSGVRNFRLTLTPVPRLPDLRAARRPPPQTLDPALVVDHPLPRLPRAPAPPPRDRLLRAGLLVQLWAEQHLSAPRQLQLPADLFG